MSSFSLRMTEQEEKIIKDYAELNHMIVSKLFRSSVLEIGPRRFLQLRNKCIHSN